CTQVVPGASGSPTIRAKLFVPAGGSFQVSAGDVSPPSHVKFCGMAPPSRKAADFNSRPGAPPRETTVGDHAATAKKAIAVMGDLAAVLMASQKCFSERCGSRAHTRSGAERDGDRAH